MRQLFPRFISVGDGQGILFGQQSQLALLFGQQLPLSVSFFRPLYNFSFPQGEKFAK